MWFWFAWNFFCVCRSFGFVFRPMYWHNERKKLRLRGICVLQCLSSAMVDEHVAEAFAKSWLSWRACDCHCCCCCYHRYFFSGMLFYKNNRPFDKLILFLLNHEGYENGSKNWFDVHWILFNNNENHQQKLQFFLYTMKFGILFKKKKK